MTPAAETVLLIATILAGEGPLATIDRGITDGLRAGDRGRVFYVLQVGAKSEKCESRSAKPRSLPPKSQAPRCTSPGPNGLSGASMWRSRSPRSASTQPHCGSRWPD